MAQCNDIKLLLGPFEDGELEPHEMQEVARHVVGCDACEAELADYRTLGLSLRNAAELPNLNGFAATVLERIDALPVPLRVRLRRFFTSFADGIGGTLATGFATAAIAVITAIVVTPYVRHLGIGAHAVNEPEIAAVRTPGSAVPAATAVASARVTSMNPGAPTLVNLAPAEPIPPDIANALSGSQIAGAEGAAVNTSAPQDAGGPSTEISRLESSSPSVAVWSEPQTDTTVIWVPDQQP